MVDNQNTGRAKRWTCKWEKVRLKDSVLCIYIFHRDALYVLLYNVLQSCILHQMQSSLPDGLSADPNLMRAGGCGRRGNSNPWYAAAYMQQATNPARLMHEKSAHIFRGAHFHADSRGWTLSCLLSSIRAQCIKRPQAQGVLQPTLVFSPCSLWGIWLVGEISLLIWAC